MARTSFHLSPRLTPPPPSASPSPSLGLDPKRDRPSLDLLYERVHPDDRTALREATLGALGDARPLDIEFRTVRPGGEVRWVRERADAFRGAGSEIRLVGVALDIAAARSGA